MHSRFINLNLLTLLMTFMFLSACNDRIPYRETITPSTQTTGGTDGGDKSGDDFVRPTGAINFKSDFCGCKAGKAITYSNCSAFCAGKTHAEEIFYANFTTTEDISLNEDLKNVAGWCSYLPETERTLPKCLIEAKDENGDATYLDVNINAGGKPNSITVPINKLSEDKTYVITLVESISGARSNSVQIVKYSGELVGPLGPLKVSPISQYTCLYMPGIAFENGDQYYDQAFRIHFYFLPSIPPSPIPAGADIRCHNFQTYGLLDDILYPRLELIPGVFNLWSSTSEPRFFDNNGNGNEDVNDLIIQKAKNFGLTTLNPSTKFFQKFPLLSTVELNEDAGNNVNAQSMGWYMAPWIDNNTYKAYCLDSEDYNGSNPLFQAMRDIIGVDTEGIYIGVKEPESFIDRDGNIVQSPGDFLLIRETDLKSVWFYLNNGVPTAPTDANVDGVAVYFYYPLNKAAPFVKSSTQKTYRVRGANELNSNNQQVTQGGSTPGGVITAFPPHDRRIGCIPKF